MYRVILVSGQIGNVPILGDGRYEVLLMTVVPLDPMYPVPVRSPTQLELNVGLIVDPSLHPLIPREESSVVSFQRSSSAKKW